MKKPLLAALAATALGACGLAHADRVNGLTRQQLARESDQSICHQLVNSPAAMAERTARNLGDCSPVTLKCRAMGYPVGSATYLQCRQTLAQEDMAASAAYAANQAAAANAAAAARAATPTTCIKTGNMVTCN